MFKKLKSSFSHLAQATPGKRFVEHYERNRQAEKGNEAAWKTAVIVAVGVVLLFAGLLLSLPPGIPGFLLWVPALGLLAARSKLLAISLDRIELLARHLFKKLLARTRKN